MRLKMAVYTTFSLYRHLKVLPGVPGSRRFCDLETCNRKLGKSLQSIGYATIRSYINGIFQRGFTRVPGFNKTGVMQNCGQPKFLGIADFLIVR